MNILKNLSDFFFKFVLNRSSEDYQYLSNTGEQNANGLTVAFIILLVVSLLAAVFFYYYIARNSTNATKQNYLSVGVMGLITMVLLNFLIIYMVTGFPHIVTSVNMWKLTGVDVFWYIILYGFIWSELIRGKSKAKNISLWRLLFNK